MADPTTSELELLRAVYRAALLPMHASTPEETRVGMIELDKHLQAAQAFYGATGAEAGI
jgi:hypothetical protein